MEKIYVDDKHRFYTIQPYKGREEKKKGLWIIKIRCDDYLKKTWMIWNSYYKPWTTHDNAAAQLEEEAAKWRWKEVETDVNL